MNRNTEYELLVKEIYEDLHKVEGYSNVKIQHNILISGKSGQKHQIDVYWEFAVAGQTYRVAIECKNYAGKLPIGKVRDFHGVLVDIGNLQGIMVSREGFQEGSVRYAKQYGISLREIRRPTDSDWEDRLREVKITGHIYAKTLKRIDVVFDSDWIKKARSDLIGKFISVNTKANGFEILNSDDSLKMTMNELVEVLPTAEENHSYVEYFHEISDGYIIDVSFGKLRILGFKFDYDISVIESVVQVNARELTKAIIKDIYTGEIRFVFR